MNFTKFFLKIILILIFIIIGLSSFFIYKPQQKDLNAIALYCLQSDAIAKTACMTKHAIYPILGVNNEINSINELNAMDTDKAKIYMAIEAMNLIQNNAGSGRYSYIHSVQKDAFKKLSLTEQSKMLERGYGICGNHQLMYMEVMKQLGIDARFIDFYFKNSQGKTNNHAAIEVKLKDKWAYFDVTWGSFWLEKNGDLSTILSIEEVLAGKGTRVSGTNTWYLYAQSLTRGNSDVNPLLYLQGKNLQILRGKGGQLAIDIKDGKADFTDIPKHFGKRTIYSELKIKFNNIPSPKAAIVKIGAAAGSCKNSVIQINNTAFPVIKSQIATTLSSKTIISIEGSDDDCYAVISKVELV